MSVSLPHPSSRLLRAAAAEQSDLVRHRERLTARRETLLSELRQLNDALTVVDERLAMLGSRTGTRAAGAAGGVPRQSPQPAPEAPEAGEAPAPDATREILR